MAYSVRKNWTECFSLIARRPILLLPFLFIAFFEGLALELIYFSPRKPLSLLVNPIVVKLFNSEAVVHYPGNLLVLPKLFYYAQTLIYIFIGVAASAVCVNIVRNLRQGLPLKPEALIKNGLKRYPSFFVFGVLMIVTLFLIRKFDGFLLLKLFTRPSYFLLSVFLFFSNIIAHTFLLLTIPIIVLKKKALFRALGESIILGWRNFASIFTLIFLPFLFYLPVSLVKSGANRLVNKTFPEINLFIAALGIMVAAVVECFIFVCATQFMLDKQ